MPAPPPSPPPVDAGAVTTPVAQPPRGTAPAGSLTGPGRLPGLSLPPAAQPLWVRGGSGDALDPPPAAAEAAAAPALSALSLDAALAATPPPGGPPDGGPANPLLARAEPVLAVLGWLATGRVADAPATLARHFTAATEDYDRDAIAAGADPHAALVGKYLLAGTVDDVAGHRNAAAAPGQPLGLVARFFHKRDAALGFFQEVDRTLDAPAPSADLLELMLVCLAVGFEGQFRGQPDGPAQLAAVRRAIAARLWQLRGPPEPALSPMWRPVLPAQAGVGRVWVGGGLVLAAAGGLAVAPPWGAAPAVAVGAALVLGRRWRRLRAARRLEAGLGPTPEAAAALRPALDALRRRHGTTALLDLPWYAVIGAAGAGRAGVIAGLGLDAPPLHGPGRTRLWLGDRAALVAAETAGGWGALPDLLARARPRLPLDGVIVTVAADALLAADPARRDAAADAVRGELGWLLSGLGVDLPVHAVVSRIDQVPGVPAWAAGLDAAARRQVWGATFQTADPKAITHESVAPDFDRLVARLRAGLPDRLAAEPEAGVRMALVALPGQLARLRDPLAGFLRRVLAQPPGGGAVASLRGFYLSAAGPATPSGAGQPGQALAPAEPLFLHDLMTQVILPGSARGNRGLTQAGVARAGRLYRTGAMH